MKLKLQKNGGNVKHSTYSTTTIKSATAGERGQTMQNNANALMKELEKHPNIIQWNPVNSEVTVEGKTLKGSNIVDLIGHVMRSRKTVKAPDVVIRF